MSLSDLRKELKDIRKKTMPVAVSKMKKAEVASELARLKGLHGAEVKKVEEVLKKEEVPKKTVKKVKEVQEVEHKKQEEVVKKTKSVKSAPVETEAPKKTKAPKAEPPKEEKKAVKGSEEMRARMARLREMRKNKSE
jgi:hypothetical protein